MEDNFKSKLLIFFIFLVIFNAFNVIADFVFMIYDNFHYSRYSRFIPYKFSILPAFIFTVVFNSKIIFVRKYLFFIIIYTPIVFFTTTHFLLPGPVASESSMELLCLTISGLSAFFELMYILTNIITNYFNILKYNQIIIIIINFVGVFLYFKLIIFFTKFFHRLIYQKLRYNKNTNKIK